MAEYYYFISSAPQPEWGLPYPLEKVNLKNQIWDTLSWEDQEKFEWLIREPDIRNLVEYHKSLRYPWYKPAFDASGSLSIDSIKSLPDGVQALHPVLYDFFDQEEKGWESLTTASVEEALYQRFFEAIENDSDDFLKAYFNYKRQIDTIQYFLLSQVEQKLDKSAAIDESLWMKLNRFGDFKSQLTTEHPNIESWKTYLSEGSYKKLFHESRFLLWQWLDNKILGHEFDIQGIMTLYLKATIAIEMQQLQPELSNKALASILEKAHLSTENATNHDNR